MKIILVDIKKMSINPTGIGMYIHQYLKNLRNDQEFKIIGVTDVLQGELIEQLSKEIKIYEFGEKIESGFNVFKYFKFIDNLIQELKPDIFWEPNNLIPINLKRKNLKIITTIHDILPITDKEYFSLKFYYYFKVLLKKTLRQSDLILTVSNTAKDEIIEHYGKIIKSEDIVVSYNIVEFDEEKINLPEKRIIEDKYFLFLGTVEKRKGIEDAIDAYENYILKNQNPNKFVIAGKVKEKLIQKKIDDFEMKYPNKIIRLGYVSEQEKESLLKNCEAFIFPTYAEGFGIPPLEALVYKKPVLVRDIPIMREVLENKVTYFQKIKEIDLQNLEFISDFENVENLLEKYSEKKVMESTKKSIKGLHNGL